MAVAGRAGGEKELVEDVGGDASKVVREGIGAGGAGRGRTDLDMSGRGIEVLAVTEGLVAADREVEVSSHKRVTCASSLAIVSATSTLFCVRKASAYAIFAS